MRTRGTGTAVDGARPGPHGPRGTGLALALGLLVAWGAAGPESARAQSVRVPVDLSAGFVAGHGPATPFRGGVELGVLAAWPRVRIGPTVGAVYAETEWKAVGGARVEVRAAGFVDVGIYPSLGFVAGADRLAVHGAALFSLADLIRTGPRVTRDVKLDDTSWEIVFGFDPSQWVKLLFF